MFEELTHRLRIAFVRFVLERDDASIETVLFAAVDAMLPPTFVEDVPVIWVLPHSFSIGK